MVALSSRNDAPHRIAHEVSRQLQVSAYSQLRRIAVVPSDGRIHLKGSVRSFFLKQMAYVTAASIVGDRPIVDEIAVA